MAHRKTRGAEPACALQAGSILASAMLVSALASIVVLGCAIAVRAQSAPAAPAAWRVQLVSQGGITGRGAGGVAAQSDGILQILENTRPVCALTLTPAQAAGLATAIASAVPQKWEKRYAPPNSPPGCCDEITWTLTLDRTPRTGGESERRGVSWVSEREAQLPADLAALRTLLLALKPSDGCPM